MSDTTSESKTQQDVNPSHVLVSEAWEQMESKLDKDEITVEDIEECQKAVGEAIDHPEADIWVSIVAQGPYNTLEHQRYPDGEYEWEPLESKREALEDIVSHEVEVTVNV